MSQPRLIGLLLIVLGAVFLLARTGWGDAWPLFVVLPGIAMLAVGIAGPLTLAGFAVPGSIVTTVGLIMLVQAATNSFHTWAYAWGLVLASTGVGTFLMSSLEGKEDGQKDGARVAIIGLAAFAVFGIFFELFIFGGLMQGTVGWVLPIVLIAAGAWMLRRAR